MGELYYYDAGMNLDSSRWGVAVSYNFASDLVERRIRLLMKTHSFTKISNMRILSRTDT